MSILNVNTIQPVGSGQTITVSATNISAPSTVVTASSFVGNVTATTISGVSTAGITTAYIGSINDGSISGARNRIINGDMRIDQRNAGASVSAAAGVYPVDRFEIENITGGGTATTQRSTTVPTGQGFTNSLLVTVTGTDTSLASTDYYTIRQIIEGQNVADLQFGASSASTVTISFWVRSSVTGTYCFSLTNGGNSRGYPVEYNISSADTWEKKTITIPGDTTGTWGTDSGRGIQCRFCMGTGTSRQGTANTWNAGEIHGTSNQTNLFATNGATFFLTGVQLESGTVATPFERRSFGQELALCERYFQVIADTADNSSQECIEMAVSSSTTGLFGCTTLRTTMRTTPTIYNTATNFRFNSPGGGDQNSTTAPTISTHCGRRNIRIEQSGYTGLTANFAGTLRLNAGTGIVAMQAEL